jgi:electron transport protein HydN
MVEVLTVDLRKCANCGACEKACAERHENGKARLKIKDVAQSRGHMYGNFVLAVSCKHCVTPVCIGVCVPQAIVREDDIVYIDDEACIGCGKCAKACPFNAIFMHEENVMPTAQHSERSILSMLFQKRKSEQVEPTKLKAKKVRKAYKCDRCKEYENMACIEVCFYNAISLMDIDELPEAEKPEHKALLERHVVAEPNELQT